MKNINCLQCEYFRMWDGDPCCLEPDNGWKIVLPDLTKDCDYFKYDNDIEYRKCWEKTWELEKYSFFENYNFKPGIYDAYLNEHPEYLGKIKKKE